MENTFISSTSEDFHEPAASKHSFGEVKHMLHALSNKLVPITVFSELALRHCQDSRVLNHLEKIRQAAEEARAIVTQIQHFEPMGESASTPGPLSPENLPKG